MNPDKGPILGEIKWEILFLAGGNWRNGVLLAPKTGQLLASMITEKKF
jgi:glycine/D-amino acid oxidase-like deaminating enzyme